MMTITRYTLGNGKVVVCKETVLFPFELEISPKAFPLYFQCWPGEPWELVDMEIFRHTPLVEVKAETRGF